MSLTDDFVRHVEGVTRHSEHYSRQLLDSRIWIVVENNGTLYMHLSDRIIFYDVDTFRFSGTHAECMQYLQTN